MTMTRFVMGTHVVRNGMQVVEIFEGDKFVAALYPAENSVRIVSNHFDPARSPALDDDYPPTLVVCFVGAEPPGRTRLDNGPIPVMRQEDD